MQLLKLKLLNLYYIIGLIISIFMVSHSLFCVRFYEILISQGDSSTLSKLGKLNTVWWLIVWSYGNVLCLRSVLSFFRRNYEASRVHLTYPECSVRPAYKAPNTKVRPEYLPTSRSGLAAPSAWGFRDALWNIV